MKKVVLIILFLALIGCKTKTVTLEKSREKDKESMFRHFDSLFQSSLKWHLEASKSQSAVASNFKLSSVPVLDSLGHREPFHYKHYVDGQLKEEIYLEGGEINKETISNQSNEVEHKDEVKKEKARIETDVGQKKATDKAKLNKAKKAKTKGFQFGFYLCLFGIIAIIIILAWIGKKFKLPDKFTSLFNTKGG